MSIAIRSLEPDNANPRPVDERLGMAFVPDVEQPIAVRPLRDGESLCPPLRLDAFRRSAMINDVEQRFIESWAEDSLKRTSPFPLLVLSGADAFAQGRLAVFLKNYIESTGLRCNAISGWESPIDVGLICDLVQTRPVLVYASADSLPDFFSGVPRYAFFVVVSPALEE